MMHQAEGHGRQGLVAGIKGFKCQLMQGSAWCLAAWAGVVLVLVLGVLPALPMFTQHWQVQARGVQRWFVQLRLACSP
ncbi:MAG: hypothetical protein ACT6T3_21905 [Agrobacterium sp.]|uniref:hypothetical protein n=1 Tax=Agrobacterium sp. TaxID=361 RepID=UPI004033A86C